MKFLSCGYNSLTTGMNQYRNNEYYNDFKMGEISPILL